MKGPLEQVGTRPERPCGRAISSMLVRLRKALPESWQRSSRLARVSTMYRPNDWRVNLLHGGWSLVRRYRQSAVRGQGASAIYLQASPSSGLSHASLLSETMLSYRSMKLVNFSRSRL